eukprot:CAMPEP_0206466752 /NCGR_PEP_ID=MMETSP0324_2-20121206/28643_1 /ASSEMBLY_ACC=CAM_ASM_000836 /TAXON_ID=2866 /ORGANISM="Crypthecodinium cohnii, Strain Seligo" /LENGTH=505 /DNA_ID=CAMNT_0053939923 /DNA_START=208 /DNA_END=1723 /DNA_ORIENTATION=+
MAQDGSTMGFANMPGMPNFMGMGGMGGMGMPSGGNLAGGGMMPQMPNMMMPPPMGGTGGAPGGTGNPMAGLLGGCCGGPGGENSGAPPDMASMMAGLGGMMGNMPRMPPMNPMALMMGMMTQAVMLSKSQATGGRPGDNSNPMASMMGGMGGMGGMPPMGNPMGMMGGSAGSSSGGPISSGGGGGGKDHEDEIDPEVKELGDYFNIEDRWIKRLNETMKKRKDTKEQDLAKLYEVLERARSPTGLLTVKIGEMECGMFVGKIKPDKDVERLARKFKLDDHVTSRLMELVVRRKAQKDEDLERIEQHLRYCKRPSAMATLLAGKLLEGEVDELPDLTEAEAIMSKYKLDEDARSKLREIVEKRAGEKIDILAKVKRHLDTSSNASSMLCKIARPLIDGEHLQTLRTDPRVDHRAAVVEEEDEIAGIAAIATAVAATAATGAEGTTGIDDMVDMAVTGIEVAIMTGEIETGTEMIRTTAIDVETEVEVGGTGTGELTPTSEKQRGFP